jgi:ABC-2 type transport system ATP-binding protein
MIEVRGLSHRYGSLSAVEDLSFTVQRGEVLGLLGPNGAGKSTTLRAIVGLLDPSEGSISIGGHSMYAEPQAARRQLGFLPEAVSLYKELQVEEMLRGVARIKNVALGTVEDELERVIELCELGAVRHRLIGFCSRGYRQRIGLAQAMLGDPPALVLDEPTVGLDPAQIVEIRGRIAELARDKAVILSTHILPEAQHLCTRVLILHQGRCVAEDRPEVLEASLRGGNRLRLVSGSPSTRVEEELSRLDFVRSHLKETDREGNTAWILELQHGNDAPRLVAALVRGEIAVRELSPERLGLEAVFLRLVREEKGGKS